MDGVLRRLRNSAIELAVTNGLEVSHLPPEFKLDIANTVILPDYLEAPDGSFKVGDEVSVDVQHVVPWHKTINRADVSDFGRYPTSYEWFRHAGSSWVPKKFLILTFAKVSSKSKSHRPTIEGVFALLSESVEASAGGSDELVVANHKKQPILHWIGGLEPFPD